MEGKKLHEIMDAFMDKEREHQKEIKWFETFSSDSDTSGED